jgi:hypothetical protein
LFIKLSKAALPSHTARVIRRQLSNSRHCHPAKAGNQYAEAYRFYHRRLWDTGSSGRAGR